MDDPLEVATEALAALDRGEWGRVARLVDPDDLARWHRAQVERDEALAPPVTAEQMKRPHPDMPDAVAEWQAAELNRGGEARRGSLQGRFAGVATREELAALAPVEALARYLQAQDPAWKLQQHLDRLDPRLRAGARPAATRPKREIVGMVGEGDGLAHVVYRLQSATGGGDATAEGRMRVATLRKGPEGWRLRLTGEPFEERGSVVVLG